MLTLEKLTNAALTFTSDESDIDDKKDKVERKIIKIFNPFQDTIVCIWKSGKAQSLNVAKREVIWNWEPTDKPQTPPVWAVTADNEFYRTSQERLTRFDACMGEMKSGSFYPEDLKSPICALTRLTPSSTMISGCEDGSIQIYDKTNGRPSKNQKIQSHAIRHLIALNESTFVTVSSLSEKIPLKIWTVTRTTLQEFNLTSQPVNCVGPLSASSRGIGGSSRGSKHINPPQHEIIASALIKHPKEMIMTATEECIILWNIADLKNEKIFQIEGGIKNVSIPADNLLVIELKTGIIQILDLEGNTLLKSEKPFPNLCYYGEDKYVYGHNELFLAQLKSGPSASYIAVNSSPNQSVGRLLVNSSSSHGSSSISNSNTTTSFQSLTQETPSTKSKFCFGRCHIL